MAAFIWILFKSHNIIIFNVIFNVSAGLWGSQPGEPEIAATHGGAKKWAGRAQ